MNSQASCFQGILLEVFNRSIELRSYRIIAGGSYNQAVCLETEKGLFLVKTNTETATDIFEKEFKGLDRLRKHTSLKIPQPIGLGKMHHLNYLLMEWIPEGNSGKNYWEELARGIAQLHGTTSDRFGLWEDNYISVLPQVNKEFDNWPEFLIENRIEKMLAKALSRRLIDDAFLKRIRKIYQRLPLLFPDEKPALLHGDLWSGNVLATESGQPCLIDPAVYFGHREMDLAFSKLFGGFSDHFYLSYNEFYPIEPGFEERVDLYNLYPLLVHLNLFGKSYLSSIEKVVKKFVD